jgi:hypothetical protein
MSLVPGAGDYFLVFSGWFEKSGTSSFVAIAVFVGGLEVTATERRAKPDGLGEPIAISTNCKLTGVGSATIVEIRWMVDSGTGEAHDRILNLIPIVP